MLWQSCEAHMLCFLMRCSSNVRVAKMLCKNEFLHLCFLQTFLFDFVKNSKHSIFVLPCAAPNTAFLQKVKNTTKKRKFFCKSIYHFKIFLLHGYAKTIEDQLCCVAKMNFCIFVFCKPFFLTL